MEAPEAKRFLNFVLWCCVLVSCGDSVFLFFCVIDCDLVFVLVSLRASAWFPAFLYSDFVFVICHKFVGPCVFCVLFCACDLCYLFVLCCGFMFRACPCRLSLPGYRWTPWQNRLLKLPIFDPQQSLTTRCLQSVRKRTSFFCQLAEPMENKR